MPRKDERLKMEYGRIRKRLRRGTATTREARRFEEITGKPSSSIKLESYEHKTKRIEKERMRSIKRLKNERYSDVRDEPSRRKNADKFDTS